MEEQGNNKKDRRRALLGTLIFHALLAVLFLFSGLKEPHPPLEEKMVSIDMNLGSDLQGQGRTESQSQEQEKSTSSKSTQQEEQQKSEQAAQDIATQEESQVSNPSEKEEQKKEPTQKEVQKKEQKQQQVSEQLRQATDRFKNMKEDGGGEGDDKTSGNEGDPRGSPKGEGQLSGAGGNWKLAGRKILRKPQPEKPTEEGKVVIDIWVDQSGNVVRTSPNLSESNTTSDELLSLAEEAAKKAKFNPDSEGAVEQKGKFTFVFELR